MSYVDEMTRRLADVEIADCGFDEPHSGPVYLTGASTPGAKAMGRHNLGLMIQPGNSTHLDWERYPLIGADNGCFALGDRFDTDEWLRWLEGLCFSPLLDRLLFAVAPDVVGDAEATLVRSAPLLPLIQKLGAPAAWVAQNGAEHVEVPWDTFDVLFLGGSMECVPCGWVRPVTEFKVKRCPLCDARLTEWKLGEVAARLTAEAHEHGKWIHMGRVNSRRRMAAAHAMRCDSADGTYLAFGPVKNLPKLDGWLAEYDEAAGVTGTVWDHGRGGSWAAAS